MTLLPDCSNNKNRKARWWSISQISSGDLGERLPVDCTIRGRRLRRGRDLQNFYGIFSVGDFYTKAKSGESLLLDFSEAFDIALGRSGDFKKTASDTVRYVAKSKMKVGGDFDIDLGAR